MLPSDLDDLDAFEALVIRRRAGEMGARLDWGSIPSSS